MRLARCIACGTAGIVCGTAAPALAYEFHIEAASVGQGYQVRWLRANESDRWLNRRRFTQTLALDVWDILAPAYDPGHPDAERRAPFQLYFTSSVRFDHDFGAYAAGDLSFDDRGVLVKARALDVVPELDEDTLQLDVPFAYLGGNRMFGWLDFRLGRQLEVQTLDWYSFDGLQLIAHTPFHVAVTAHGGLLVRSSSLWGTPAHEPDGTESASCRAVELGGSTWVATDSCAQRHALMPGFGVALESEGLRHVHARLAYRRAVSKSADIYPAGAPAWGVNEERAVAEVRAELGPLAPFAAARYDLVLGLVDEAEAGARLVLGAHTFTPGVAYSYPSFDADSIFNVFAAEAYWDASLGYDLWPGHGVFRGFARSYLRTFDAHAHAVGVTLGSQLRFERGRIRLDAFHDVGHGGSRIGSDLSGAAQLRWDWQLDGRLTLVDTDEEDEGAARHALTVGLQGGARYLLYRDVALHLVVEENSNRYERNQLRLMAILDFAFTPEI